MSERRFMPKRLNVASVSAPTPSPKPYSIPNCSNVRPSPEKLACAGIKMDARASA
jgi:hypothetical protein